MARSRKQTDKQRQHRLPSIRVTAEELADITSRFNQAGLTASEYLRRAALSARLTLPKTARADPALIAELNRIGVNLNQIARAVNSTGRLPPTLPDLCDQLQQIVMKAVEQEEA